MSTDMEKLYFCACSLYGGGWRASDHDLLIHEYGLSGDDLDFICQVLAQLEEEGSNN